MAEPAGKIEPGTRVRVPVGKGSRIGLVLGRPAGDYGGNIRDILSLVDERPILPGVFVKLVEWFGETYLCGTGSAAKILLPASFMKGLDFDLGKDAPPPSFTPPSGRGPLRRDSSLPGVSFVYELSDSERMARYAEMISDMRPTIAAFPLYPAAKRFYEMLLSSELIPDDLKQRVMLYPRSGAKAEWRAWSRLIASSDVSVIVGGQSAATAPLTGVKRIIIEDESNNVWRTMRPPVYNVRSLMAKRARIEGAELVLGGRMPSSRAFARFEESVSGMSGNDGKPGKCPSSAPGPEITGKTYFVDIRLAYSPSVKGVCDTLAVSEPLVRETEAALSAGSWAVWILDRKGYAGEVICEECGSSQACPMCKGAMRWEASKERLRCVVCSAACPVPESCPVCSGRLLVAKRPGLEALLPLARSAINPPVPIILMDGDDGEKEFLNEAREAPAGLLLGTRASLSICDTVRVGMVGWIDADGEARSRDYDAKARAFGLMFESRWRGVEPEGRTLVLQSRRPGKEWQRGLDDARCGWRTFWRKELAERCEFGMPPYNSLIRIDIAASGAHEIAGRLNGLGRNFEYWISEPEEGETGSTVWIRTLRLGELRKALAPLFDIRRAKRGYPKITVWHE